MGFDTLLPDQFPDRPFNVFQEQKRDVFLKFENVTCEFKSRGESLVALRNISCGFQRGGVTSIVGRNGSGKSTLLKAALGLVTPTQGFVTLSKNEVLKGFLGRKIRLGVVAQTNSLDEKLTVGQNLMLAARMFGCKPQVSQARSEVLLRAFDLTSDQSHIEQRKVAALSGGQKRKLDIIRALSHDPEILFLDEASAGLDLQSTRRMWGILNSMIESPEHALSSIVSVTHHSDELEHSFQIVLLEKGETALIARRDELAALPSLDVVTVGLVEGVSKEDRQHARQTLENLSGISFAQAFENSLFSSASLVDGALFVPKVISSLGRSMVASIQFKPEGLLDKVYRLAHFGNVGNEGDNENMSPQSLGGTGRSRQQPTEHSIQQLRGVD